VKVPSSACVTARPAKAPKVNVLGTGMAAKCRPVNLSGQLLFREKESEMLIEPK